MRVLRSLPLLVVLVIPAGARASDHKADLYVAASYLDAKGSDIKLKGWHVSTALSIKEYPWLSVVGDLSAHFWGTDDVGNHVTQMTLMVGPRVAPFGERHSKHKVFAHLMLVGAVHRSGEGAIGNVTAGALAGGGGYEFIPGAARARPWGARFEIDYIRPVVRDLGSGWRYSAGVIYRFPYPHK